MKKFAKIVQALSYWPVYLALRLFWNYKVEGQENLRGLGNRGVIFASNHASVGDGPICGVSLIRNNRLYPGQFFPVRFLAWDEYRHWNNPFPFPLNLLAALYVRANGSIGIKKAGGDLPKALDKVIRVLKDNQKIWIFPEGKRSEDGRLGQGKRGVAFLQKETGAPVIPVGLTNTFKMFSLRNILKRRRIFVKIGKPIFSLEGLSLEQGVNKVMAEIAGLLAG